jgi:hypothetical protein
MNEEMQAILKSEGLEALEEGTKAAIKSFIKSAPKLALASENKYDDMLVPLLGVLEPALLKLAEEINPADNAAE